MFYTFRQNNSGGSYLGPVLVCVECDSHSEANDEAQRHGFQFGMDCECCGPRWSLADGFVSPDLTETPTYHGNSLTKSGKSWEVYYRDGVKLSGGRSVR